MSIHDLKVVNYMDGISFKPNPLKSLQLVVTSMIRGESQYYRLNNAGKKFANSFLFSDFYENEESSTNFFDKIVNDALDYDFEGVIQFIEKLRNEYQMRLNPQLLVVAALLHPNRVQFNKNNPLVLKQAIKSAGSLPTDYCKQYELLVKSGQNKIPTLWKRTVAEYLESMSKYHAAKYIHGTKTGNGKSTDESTEKVTLARGKRGKPLVVKKEETTYSDKKSKVSLVDLIRITHPKGKEGSVISEIVKTGKVVVADDEMTWEKLKSAGKTWKEIMQQIRLPHMALLRNLRGILKELQYDESGDELVDILVELLVSGVKNGRQFPFRYFSAHRALRNAGDDILLSHLNKVSDALERCLFVSMETLPELKGRVDCLTDNSGSAHGAFVSAYGSVKVSEISNLSSILTCMRATNGGSIWVFGDRLVEYVVDKTKSVLEQLEKVNSIGVSIGQGTETGVWLFWQKMINSKINLDHVFIYSDMQCGYGGLYVDSTNTKSLNDMNANVNSNISYGHSYIDVLKLVNIYREKVKAKMNIFCIQCAGYDNTVLPDFMYRGGVMSGWTGKEVSMAAAMIKLWDEIENIN